MTDSPAPGTLLSVVIPTHNPRRESLDRVLAGLRAQTLAAGQWQLVIVDNASEPPVSPAIVADFPGSTVLRESRLGLTYARLAGIAAAAGDVVVFVDDDNVLGPDYLAEAMAFFAAQPTVGAIGGRIVGEFARSPEPWARPHLELLALRDHGDAPLISQHHGSPITQYDYFAPLGAGMAVRTAAARSYAAWVGNSPVHLTDRRGDALSASGDCELILCVLTAGWQIAYVPALRVTHLIPANRLTFDYFSRLSYAGAESWGSFLRRHGLARPIPRWSVALRQLKAFFTRRAWTRSGRIAWRGACGYFSGLAS